MRRTYVLGFIYSLVAFAAADYLTNALFVWLQRIDGVVALAFLNQVLWPFLPFILAGLFAGYLGAPCGFLIGLLAGLCGALWSLTWKYESAWNNILSSEINIASAVGWSLGVAFASGVCGWAGERLHAER